MPSIRVILDGDNAWPDINDRGVIHVTEAPIQLAALAGGMTSGRTSLAFRIDLPDGNVVVAETSLALFNAAWHALHGRFADEMDHS